MNAELYQEFVLKFIFLFFDLNGIITQLVKAANNPDRNGRV